MEDAGYVPSALPPSGDIKQIVSETRGAKASEGPEKVIRVNVPTPADKANRAHRARDDDVGDRRDPNINEVEHRWNNGGESNISVVNYATETANVGTPALPEVMAPETIRSESRFSVPYNEERDTGNSRAQCRRAGAITNPTLGACSSA